MSTSIAPLAAALTLAACSTAQAEPLPARIDEAAVLAHQEAMATSDTRVWGVSISDASGAVDSETDLMIALPAGANRYHAAFYRGLGAGRYERVGTMVTFDGTRVPRLSNHGAIGPCLAAPTISGQGTTKYCATDGAVRRVGN